MVKGSWLINELRAALLIDALCVYETERLCKGIPQHLGKGVHDTSKEKKGDKERKYI